MRSPWHVRWDPVVLAGLGGFHLLVSFWLLPSGLLLKYPSLAELARAGRLSGEQGAPASPLYLLIHVAFSAGLVRWLQCAAVLGSMVLIYQVGRRLVDPLMGLISAGLFSLSAVVLAYGATFEPDLFLMAACLLGVWATPRAATSLGHAALFGIGMGLAISLRPTAGLVAMVLYLGLMVQSVRSAALGSSWRPLVLAGAVTACAGVAPIVGVQGLYSSPARGTMSPGTAFYDGNRPESIGVGVTNPWLIKAAERQEGPNRSSPDLAHALYREFARLDGGSQMTLAETQQYWADKSWEFARLEAGAFVSGALRKVLFLLAGTEYHDISEVRRAFVSLARLPFVRYRWLAILGLAGMLLAAWKRRMPWWVWGYLGAGAAGLVLFSVVTRYALVFLPAMILFAAFLIREASFIRRWRPAAGMGVCLLLGGLPGLSTPVRWDARVQERVLRAHEHVDELAGRRGDFQGAMISYVTGQSYFPFLSSTMNPRGLPFESRRLALESALASERRGVRSPADSYFQAVLWQRAGDCGRALPAARIAAESGFFTTEDSRLLDPNLLMAECLISDGRGGDAMSAAMASLKTHPATADGLAMAIAGSRATGLFSTEVPEWEARLSRIHDPLSAGFALLRSYRTWGEGVLALEVSERLLRWLPGSAAVEYQVALLHAEAGDAIQAFDALQRAHASDPGLTLEMAPFEGILDQMIVADPYRRDVWIAKVDQAAQSGRFEDAAGAASEAMGRLGEDPELLELQRVMGQLASLFGNDTG